MSGRSRRTTGDRSPDQSAAYTLCGLTGAQTRSCAAWSRPPAATVVADIPVPVVADVPVPVVAVVPVRVVADVAAAVAARARDPPAPLDWPPQAPMASTTASASAGAVIAVRPLMSDRYPRRAGRYRVLKHPYKTNSGLTTCCPFAARIVCCPTNVGGDSAL